MSDQNTFHTCLTSSEREEEESFDIDNVKKKKKINDDYPPEEEGSQGGVLPCYCESLTATSSHQERENDAKLMLPLERADIRHHYKENETLTQNLDNTASLHNMDIDTKIEQQIKGDAALCSSRSSSPSLVVADKQSASTTAKSKGCC